MSRHDTSRHDKHDVWCESWRDVLCRAVSCVLRCACSNMADDEESVVLACKTISFFIIVYYFSLQMRLIHSLQQMTAVITWYTLQTKLRIAPAALVVTCCVALAVQHDTARTRFSYAKMHGLDNESWRIVTWCNKWNLGNTRIQSTLFKNVGYSVHALGYVRRFPRTKRRQRRRKRQVWIRVDPVEAYRRVNSYSDSRWRYSSLVNGAKAQCESSFNLYSVNHTR